MPPKSTLELISFKVCPFVQRSVITLKEKNVAFKTTYVDLQNLPDWFAKISPLGKVPILKVDDTIVFESAVIAEYLDESYAPSLHPKDLLKKAKHRSWTEFSSDITMNMFAMLHAETEKKFNELKGKVVEQFIQVETAIDSKGPYFDGESMSLVDAAYAPVFTRLQLIENSYPLHVFDKKGRIADWSNALINRNSVNTSVVDDFDELFMAYLKSNGGFLSKQM